MKSLSTYTFTAAAIAAGLLLAACSSESSDGLPADVVTVPVPSVESVAVSSSTTVASSPDDTTTTTEDTRTPEEALLDDLDLMVAQLTGVQDIAKNSDCVVERLESEGVPLTGAQGSPELAALIGCAPEAIDGVIRIDPGVASAETRTCLTSTLATWIGSLPLTEAQGFFESPTPPDALITLLSSICDLPEDEVLAILSAR